jgi:hypothetical protein
MNTKGEDVAAGILQCLNERKKKPEIALRDYFKETKPNTT